MSATRTFAARSVSDISSLIRDYPLAWLVSAGEGGIHSTQVPLLADFAPDGGVIRLLGHVDRRNPHLAALQQDGRATALFAGPHGYISPSWFRDRTQAPTWNLTTVKIQLQVSIDDRSACADSVLARLVEQMERGRPQAWSVADMAERYHQLRRGIVGFYGQVFGIEVKFKLGQNERLDVLADQIAGLEANGNTDLAKLMREHNDHRAQLLTESRQSSSTGHD